MQDGGQRYVWAALVLEFEGGGGAGDDFAVEAGAAVGVAGAGAFLVNVEDDRVLVAVGADFADGLGVSGGGAFVPDFLAAPRVVNGLADFEGHAEGFGIHPGEHEGFLGLSIDGHGGEEAVGVELRDEGGGFVSFFALWFGSKGDGVACAHDGGNLGWGGGGVEGEWGWVSSVKCPKSKVAGRGWEGRNTQYPISKGERRGSLGLQGEGEWAAWGPMAVTAEKAFELVRGAHERERLAHAFLISGPAGSGKQALAARIVELVNPPADEGAVGLFGEPEESVAEKTLDELQGPYVTLVRPRSKSRLIRIDEVRELEREMHLTAPGGNWKVGVIVDADRMRDAPANAFLKTLEEPPPECLLILLTANPELLLPTIRSRCVDLVLQSSGREDVLQPQATRMFAKVLARTAKERSEKNALLVKASFEGFLAERKAEIAGKNGAALKEEVTMYKRATDGKWLEEREVYYAALTEAEYLSVRTALLDLLMTWMGDAVRQKTGAATLSYPELKEETGTLAESRDMDGLLSGLDALQELREMFNTNVQEGLTMEVGFLRAFA